MGKSDSDSHDLKTPLDLDGYTIEVGGGFWTSFRVMQVPPDEGRPNGSQYALTRHATPTAFDHAHRDGKVVPYAFKGPGELLEDFWSDVEAILTKEGLP